MPIVVALRNKNLMAQHWQKIKVLIDKDFDINNEEFTLQALIALDINEFAEQITEISAQATGEFKLRQQLDALEETWKVLKFTTIIDEKTETPILGKEIEEVLDTIDESLAEVNMILGSRFVAPLRDEAEKKKKEILQSSDLIDEWTVLLRNWRYLYKIFDPKNQDILQTLPEENKKFQAIDKQFKAFMT